MAILTLYPSVGGDCIQQPGKAAKRTFGDNLHNRFIIPKSQKPALNTYEQTAFDNEILTKIIETCNSQKA
ncbi:MAG: hypothetical protein ABSB91_00730 [Sedimentisphaerales bacterium]|jgi:hypothetical protein